MSELISGQFGRYQILKLLGQGGMGAVYLAHDSVLNRDVALKIPQLSPGDGAEDVVARFYREAESAARLHHPNICPVYDVGEIDGSHYLTMRYIEGRPLTKFINADRPQNPRNVAIVIRKLASALEAAHKEGVIHRDLKPANVMMDAHGEPVVMDFGLARQVHSKKELQLTQSGMIVGTPAYMSPEQVAGRSDGIGPQTDIWSLGVILFEMLTARLPYQGTVMQVIGAIQHTDPPPPSQFRGDIPPKLVQICRKMLERDVSQRYHSMTEVIRDLQAFLKSNSATGAGSDPSLATAAVRASRVQPAADETSAESAPLFSRAEPTIPAKRPKRKSKLRAAIRDLPRWTLPAGGLLGLLLLAGLVVKLASGRHGQSADGDVEGSSVEMSAEDDGPTGPPELKPVSELNSQKADAYPWISPDGKRIYWETEEGQGVWKVWQAERNDASSRFRNPRVVLQGRQPALTPDELQIVAVQKKQLIGASRASVAESFGPASKLASFESYPVVHEPFISADGLTLVADAWNRDAPKKAPHVVARRKHLEDPWGPAESIDFGWNSLAQGGPLHGATLAPDELTILGTDQFSDRYRVMRSTRASKSDLFAQFEELELPGLGAINGRAPRYVPATQELFLTAPPNLAMGKNLQKFADGKADLWVVKNVPRTAVWAASSTTDELPELKPLSELNSEGHDEFAWLSADGLRIYFETPDPEGNDKSWICTAERPDFKSPFNRYRRLINGRQPTLSTDERTIFFVRSKGAVKKLYAAKRKSRDDRFDQATELGQFSPYDSFNSPFISADGSHLYVNARHAQSQSWRYLSAKRKGTDGDGGQFEEHNQIRWDNVKQKSPLTWISFSPDELSLLATHEGEVGRWRVVRSTRKSTSEPFENFEYLTLPNVGTVYGRAPRYFAPTKELFLTAPADYAEAAKPWNTIKSKADLWVIRNVQFTASTPPAKSGAPPADAVSFGRKRYKPFAATLTWHEAKKLCQDLGGRLAEPRSAEENAFLAKFARGDKLDGIWIGASDEAKEGTWVWNDGSSVNAPPWDKGQPNNVGGSENFAMLLARSDFDGLWWDQPNVSGLGLPQPWKTGFVCEWDAPPEAARLPDARRGAALRWFGVSLASAARFDDVADDVNLVFDGSWLQEGDTLAQAVRARGKTLLVQITRGQLQSNKLQLYEFVHKNRDVVAGVVLLVPYAAKAGLTTEQIGAIGKRLKEVIPGISYWVSYIDLPAGMSEPLPPVPPEVDVIEVNHWYVFSPKDVNQKAERLVLGWIGRAKGRPLVMRWMTKPQNWNGRSPLKTTPGALRAFAEMTEKHGFAGLVIDHYGPDPRKFAPPLYSDPAAHSEFRELAKKYGLGK